MKIHLILNYLFAAIWLFYGFYGKMLNLIPRHELIVARILGNQHAHKLTITIGLLEILMAAWIISGIRRRLNAIFQMLLIGIMNIIELILVPDLLLWGKFNSVFALLLIFAIYYNEFVINKTPPSHT